MKKNWFSCRVPWKREGQIVDAIYSKIHKPLRTCNSFPYQKPDLGPAPYGMPLQTMPLRPANIAGSLYFM